MTASDSNQASLDEGLPRLPPGRHGLDRAFVVKNQRDRLTAGIIAVVGKGGYGQATITQICAEAGVSRRTFYSYFGAKEDCYLDALERVMGFLDTEVRRSGEDAADWPAAVRARLATLLGIFSANPDLVRFCWTAPLRAGRALIAVYHANVERVLSLLAEGMPAGTMREPSPLIQQSIVGGMMASITLRADSEKTTELIELLPDLVELFLAQYLGRENAAVVATDTGGG